MVLIATKAREIEATQTVRPTGWIRKRWCAFLPAAALFVGMYSAALMQEAPNRSLTKTLSATRQSASLTGKPESWWMAKDYEELEHAPNMVLLGSSQMQCFCTTDAKESGHDVDQVLDHHAHVIDRAFSQKIGKPIETFNASIAGSMMSDRYLIEKVLFQTPRKPALVFIGIAPRDFIDATLPSVSSTEPFQFFAPMLNRSEFDSHDFSDKLDQANYQMLSRFPLRTIIDSGWLQKLIPFHTDKISKTLAQETLPFQPGRDSLLTLRPGKCLIPHRAFEGFINNTVEYRGRYHGWKKQTYEQQLAYFDRLITDLNARGIQVAVIGMPLDEMNWRTLDEKFWSDYSNRIKTLTEKHNVHFWDLSHSPEFAHTDFADGVHLNWRGGGKLANLMASFVATDSNLVRQLQKKP